MSLSLRKIRFSKNKFFASILEFNNKYNCPKSQNNNLFYLFNNQLDYVLAHYFAKFKTIKGNVNKILFDLLIVLLMQKLFYQNSGKWIKKFSKIIFAIMNNK